MKREVLEKKERQLDNLEQSIIEFERLQKIFKTQTIAIYLAIFLLFTSIVVNAQTSHIVDTVKYKYYDLSWRRISNSFFYQPTLGWRMRMIADDGIREREVFVDTIERPINTYKY